MTWVVMAKAKVVVVPFEEHTNARGREGCGLINSLHHRCLFELGLPL
jgi:hypothetical protein